MASSRDKNKKLLSAIRDLVGGLPSRGEKEEIDRSFASLIEFFAGLQQTFRVLPAAEQLNAVKTSVQTLEGLFEKARSNPIIASALGVSAAPKSRRSISTASESQTAKARETLSLLQSLPVDEIRVRLGDRIYSVADLRMLASELGLRSVSKLNRDSLVHQIAMKIANYRGYQQLSGELEQRPLQPVGAAAGNNGGDIP